MASVSFGHGLIEHFALGICDFEFKGSGLARTVGALRLISPVSLDSPPLAFFSNIEEISTYRKSTSSPRGPTMNFVQIGELTKGGLRAQRDIDHAMMGKGAHSSDASRLLSTSQTGGRNEEACVFTPEATLLPLATGSVEESLPLRGEVAVASRDTEEDAVVFLKFGGSDGGDGRVLGWCVHLLEHFFGECLLHSEGLNQLVW